MIKKATLITLIFIVNTFIQLISQIVVTRMFGARLDLDIFLAAVALPTIIVTVIYGTLNDAFLPLLGREKSRHPKLVSSYFFSHLIMLGLISFAVSIVLSFFSEALSNLLYEKRGEQFVRHVGFQMRYMFLSIPFSVIATLLGSYFYLEKKFIRFPLAQAAGSLANLLLIILLAPQLGIWSLVVAFVLNIAFQLISVLPMGIFPPKLASINLTALFSAWIPLIIGSFALRADSLFIRSLAASLPTGYLVYLNVISKFFFLATGVMTIGIQVLLLPHLVEYFSKKQYGKASRTINQTKLASLAISILVIAAITIISPIIINLLFVGGRFTRKDAEITISLMPLFMIPAIGWGINSIFFQPLIALKKQIELSLIHVSSLGSGWVVGFTVAQYFGPLPGIAIGLIVMHFFGILASEILWQLYKRDLTS